MYNLLINTEKSRTWRFVQLPETESVVKGVANLQEAGDSYRKLHNLKNPDDKIKHLLINRLPEEVAAADQILRAEGLEPQGWMCLPGTQDWITWSKRLWRGQPAKIYYLVREGSSQIATLKAVLSKSIGDSNGSAKVQP